MTKEKLKQEPKIGRCKECKYFEHDSVFAEVNGIPLFVHNICKKWGNGCKTREDGYCFMFERQEESKAQEALNTALNAFDEVEKYKYAIENIKAEIKKEHDSCGNFSDGIATASGLEWALEIINKHLKVIK